MFGLLFILVFTWVLHQGFGKKSHLVVIVMSLAQFAAVVTVYIFVQLNFDLVSHNFGTKVDQFIDSTQFLLTVFVGLILASLRLLKQVNSFY